jgi:hypothetical protein
MEGRWFVALATALAATVARILFSGSQTRRGEP